MDTNEATVGRRPLLLSGRPVALMLGSGFSRLAGLVKPVRRIPYAQIEGLSSAREANAPLPHVATAGTIDGKQAIVYPSKLHLFQGYSALEVTALVRHAHASGCGVAVFVGACGSVNSAKDGCLGLVSDHINLTGCNPLVDRGVHTDAFLPMRDAYDPELRELVHRVAQAHGIGLQEGVYAEMRGPSLETPAEVRALQVLGADYVGMSLSLEVIMARALGMRVLAFALPTNEAGDAGVSHSSVRLEATSYARELEVIVRGVLAGL